MDNLFFEAIRRKVRFDTPQGQLSVEDLWDLPLSCTNRTKANLDNIAIDLDRRLKECTTISFVKKTKKTGDLIKLKFDIVLQIIKTKQEEEEIAEQKQINKEKKQKLLAIIDQKENAELVDKPIEELRKIVNEL